MATTKTAMNFVYALRNDVKFRESHEEIFRNRAEQTVKTFGLPKTDAEFQKRLQDFATTVFVDGMVALAKSFDEYQPTE